MNKTFIVEPDIFVSDNVKALTSSIQQLEKELAQALV